jgi:hypothetical protein
MLRLYAGERAPALQCKLVYRGYDLYQIPERVTHEDGSRIGGDLIQHGKRREVCHGGSDCLAGRL